MDNSSKSPKISYSGKCFHLVDDQKETRVSKQLSPSNSSAKRAGGAAAATAVLGNLQPEFTVAERELGADSFREKLELIGSLQFISGRAKKSEILRPKKNSADTASNGLNIEFMFP